MFCVPLKYKVHYSDFLPHPPCPSSCPHSTSIRANLLPIFACIPPLSVNAMQLTT